MIRRAASADLDQILRIERAAFTAPHWPWEAYERLLEDGETTQHALFVEVDTDGEQRIRGFVGGSLCADEAQLESIAVAEAARSQGLGRALCLMFVRWAKLEGARSVDLEVRASSDGVQRLYAEVGFEVVGLRPRYYSNPVEDGVLMRCLL